MVKRECFEAIFRSSLCVLSLRTHGNESVHMPSWKRFIKLTQMFPLAAFLQFVTVRRMDGAGDGHIYEILKI